MSVLQEYENIREQIGENMYSDIERYLKENPTKLLSDVYYSESEWKAFEKWRLLNSLEFKLIKKMTSKAMQRAANTIISMDYRVIGNHAATGAVTSEDITVIGDIYLKNSADSEYKRTLYDFKANLNTKELSSRSETHIDTWDVFEMWTDDNKGLVLNRTAEFNKISNSYDENFAFYKESINNDTGFAVIDYGCYKRVKFITDNNGIYDLYNILQEMLKAFIALYSDEISDKVADMVVNGPVEPCGQCDFQQLMDDRKV